LSDAVGKIHADTKLALPSMSDSDDDSGDEMVRPMHGRVLSPVPVPEAAEDVDDALERREDVANLAEMEETLAEKTASSPSAYGVCVCPVDP